MQDRKIETQEGQLRKLQIQLLQHEGSADVLESDTASAPKLPGGNSAATEGGGENHGESVDGDGAENHATKRLEEENGRLRENVRLLSTQVSASFSSFSSSSSSSSHHHQQALITSITV